MNAPLVTIEELSRMIDGELEGSMLEDVRARMDQCPISKQLFQRMQELTSVVAGAIIEAPINNDEPMGLDCLSDEALLALGDGRLGGDDLLDAERHAITCKRCLRRILQGARSAVTMQSDNWQELPDDIRNDPRINIVANLGAKRREYVAREKAKNEVELNIIGKLEYVMSAGNKAEKAFVLAPLSIVLNLKSPTSGAATLEVSAYTKDAPMSQVEFVVNVSGGKKIFRGLTGNEGKIVVRRMYQGSFDIHIPAKHAAIQLRLVE